MDIAPASGGGGGVFLGIRAGYGVWIRSRACAWHDNGVQSGLLLIIAFLFLALSGLQGVGGGGCLCPISRLGCVQYRELGARARMALSFSDTLLVVSILDIVYDCHLRPLLQS